MRDSVIAKIKGLSLNGISVSQELPYDESGVARYTKNPKTIYVDNAQKSESNIIQTLDLSVNLNQQTTSVSIYFTTDAKNPLYQYDTLVSSLRNLKNTIQLDGATQREVAVNTSFEDDLLITQMEYTLTRLA